jgi:spore germination protein GerM
VTTRSRPARAVIVTMLGLASLALAACAIPTQSAPNTLAPSKVPFDLLDPHPPNTTTTQPKLSSYVPVKVYFLTTNEQLTPVQRYVPPPAPLSAVVDSMLAGPSTLETAQGIATAIPSDVSALSVTQPQNNVVTVNMNTAFGEITGTNAELAVAQIVSTIAAEAGPSTGVIFEIEGERTSVPIANGSEVAGPVYLLDFLGTAP